MVAFLGKNYTDEQIAELAEFTSFKSMQKQEQNYTLAMRAMQIMTDETVFFRKGKISDWANHFTKEQSEKMGEAIRANLKSPIKFMFIYGV
jgi:hypothetical protein